MIKMQPYLRSALPRACILVVVGYALVALCDEPKMYLCSDTVSQPKSKDKLVYGYINDKKTECMSEYEFLALYSKAQFEKDSIARKKKEKEAIQAAKQKATRGTEDEIVLKIRKGKKDLDGADLMEADLSGVDLRGASLKSADLRRANLSKANLSGADLQAAFLRRADVRKADLTNANLRGAYFSEADLRGAKGLTLEKLKECKSFYKAKLDDEVRAVVKAELPEKLKEPEKCWENNAWSDNDDCKPSTSKPRPR
jgi:hypothetical protein